MGQSFFFVVIYEKRAFHRDALSKIPHCQLWQSDPNTLMSSSLMYGPVVTQGTCWKKPIFLVPIIYIALLYNDS